MGQEFRITYDHTALKVTNLERSAVFYSEVLELVEIEIPYENPILRWFSLGGSLQLHLIEDSTADINTDIATHVAVRVDNMNAFINHLVKRNIPYRDWLGHKQTIAIRPDGIKQVYIQDPDGHWIEVNDVSNK